jgi:methylmalonyl-CoA mutase
MLVERSLRGASIGTLTRQTHDGVTIAPLYTTADAPEGRVIARATPGAWDIRQIVSRPDPLAANADALTELEGGATSIELRIDQEDGRGVRIASAADLARTLDGVMLDLAPVALDAGADPSTARLLAEHANKTGLKSASLAFGLDPFASLLARPAIARTDEALAFLKSLGDDFPSATALRIDARPVHEAGGGDHQELAYVLAAGAALLRAGEGAGIEAAALAKELTVSVALGLDPLMEIVKLRAARLVWARLLSVCGVGAPMRLHAQTGRRMMTQRDAWTNMLRVTTSGYAAGVGGADAVTTLPLTEALGQPTPFARRIARNTQHLLIEECGLAHVADPAAGAWAAEALTDELAHAAWALFQEIERRGGLVSAFAWFCSEVAQVREARLADVARGVTPVLGVSQYPLLGEAEVAAEPWPGPAAPPRAGLPPMRLAEPFERLRDAAAKANTPEIFLATLGPPAQFASRANFAKSFFESGGLKAIGGEAAHDNSVALTVAFETSGAKAACLCGGDEHYANDGATVAAALREAGAKYISIAGKADVPGVDGRAFAGADRIEALKRAHAALGIAS